MKEVQRLITIARRTGSMLSLAFLDIDNLKGVNDSRGHAAGDLVLVTVAQTVRAALRVSDLLVRYGGDEFLCVLPGTDLNHATARLSTVNTKLRRQLQPGSVTIGVAGVRDDDTAATLIAR